MHKFISRASIKSYWHAYLAIAVAYAAPYFKALIASQHPQFNLYYFGWGLLGALTAPATRSLVAKYPFLSPLSLRITTKIAQEQKLSTPNPVAVTFASIPAVVTNVTPITQASGFTPGPENTVNP